MIEQEINEFLLKARIASDNQRKLGNISNAVNILQASSLVALRHLPKPCIVCRRQYCVCDLYHSMYE